MVEHVSCRRHGKKQQTVVVCEDHASCRGGHVNPAVVGVRNACGYLTAVRSSWCSLSAGAKISDAVASWQALVIPLVRRVSVLHIHLCYCLCFDRKADCDIPLFPSSTGLMFTWQRICSLDIFFFERGRQPKLEYRITVDYHLLEISEIPVS
jgi:hypothetical protein